MAINPWLLIAGYVFIVVVATLPMLMIPLLMYPRTRDPLRTALFESGQVPVGEARRRYVMQYYPYMLMFIAFDVLAMFLLVWAMAFTRIGFDGSVMVLIFLVLLAAPLLYSLRLAGRRELW